MKAPKNVLQKAIREGVQLLGDRQAAESFLLSDNTDVLLTAFEDRGVHALVRGVFGRICMERKTGGKDLSPCEFEDPLSRAHKPVPAPYDLVLEKRVSRDLDVDLADELLPTYVSVHMKRAATLTDEELNRALLDLYGVETPVVAVSGVMQVYAMPPLRGGDPSMNGGILGAFEWKEEPLIKPFNAIDHVSDWDGTLRTLKALYALRRYEPNSAGEIARIWLEERNPLKNVEDVEFPMFLEDPNLVEFVEANLPQDDLKWKNWYISRWDLTDSVADMWTLSPMLHEAYPTVDKWFSGVNIGKGWQELLMQVQTILDRNRLSGRGRG